MKVAVVGCNAYLARNIENIFEDITLYKRLEFISHVDILKTFDYVINFSIQPNFKQNKLNPYDIIDVKIANIIKNSDTKLVMVSSRKVYGSSDKLKKYSEKSELKATDFYSCNKITAEQYLQNILPNRCLILRVGNIIDLPENTNNSTFISWINNSLKNDGILNVTENENVRKDFITRDYFQYALQTLINKQETGVYNIGAGFTLTLKELLPYITGNDKISFKNNAPKRDCFVLDCQKAQKIIKPFSKQELYNKCTTIRLNIIR